MMLSRLAHVAVGLHLRSRNIQEQSSSPSPDQQASHNGDLMLGVKAGVNSRDDVAQLGDVLIGTAEGGQSERDVTVFGRRRQTEPGGWNRATDRTFRPRAPRSPVPRLAPAPGFAASGAQSAPRDCRPLAELRHAPSLALVGWRRSPRGVNRRSVLLPWGRAEAPEPRRAILMSSIRSVWPTDTGLSVMRTASLP